MRSFIGRLKISELSLTLMFFGVFLIGWGTSWRYPTEVRALPVLVFSSGALLSVVQLLSYVSWKRKLGVSAVYQETKHTSELRRQAIALSCPFVCLLVMYVFGFTVASLAATILLPLSLGFRRWLPLLIMGPTITLALELLFRVVMNNRLPVGLLGIIDLLPL